MVLLLLDDGTLLTEGPAVVQYLADRKPEACLIPANDSPERYLMRRFAYVDQELSGKAFLTGEQFTKVL